MARITIIRSLAFILLTAALPTIAAAGDIDETESIFTDMTFADAKAKAAAEDRLFVVMATASWCGPCQHMKKTTWADPAVREWVDEHAIVYLLDVDKYQPVARRLKVSAMPTTIVYRDGEIFDRVVGYRDAEALLDWLNGVREGRRALDGVRERVEQAEGAGEVDVHARYDLAKALAQQGDATAAAEEFAWLWDHMLEHDPAMVGVRGSFMVSQMRRLAEKSEDARQVFAKLRDRHTEAVQAGEAAYNTIDDWITLNRVIGDEAATLALYDSLDEHPKRARILAVARSNFFPLLIEHDRWAEAGELYDEPVASAATWITSHKQNIVQNREIEEHLTPEQLEDVRESARRGIRRTVAKLYAATLAAEREEAADEIAAMLLEADDTPEARIALIEWTIEADVADERHIELLDEAEAASQPRPELREKLNAALATTT